MVIVDSDRHVVEPPELRLPSPPEVAPGRRAGPTTGRYHPIWGSRQFSSLIKFPPGPAKQLADTDAEGVDLAVLYPSMGLGIGLLDDLAAAQRAARAYNDWLAQLCRAAPERLKGVALVAPRQPSAADELLRCVLELGFVA